MAFLVVSVSVYRSYWFLNKKGPVVENYLSVSWVLDHVNYGNLIGARSKIGSSFSPISLLQDKGSFVSIYSFWLFYFINATLRARLFVRSTRLRSFSFAKDLH